MSPPGPEYDSEAVAQLGEPRLVCRTSRKTLFWGFLLASLLCGSGAAVLVAVLRSLMVDWSKDVFGSAVLLAVALLLLWGGRALWRKADRKRRVRVVVHTHGLSYRDGSTCLTCRWDQIEDVRWRIWNNYEDTCIALGGVVPVPGTTTRSLIHTSHQVTVLRKDGVQLVFTDELQNIAGLARAIRQEASRNISERPMGSDRGRDFG
jgi:hypothetical protein